MSRPAGGFPNGLVRLVLPDVRVGAQHCSRPRADTPRAEHSCVDFQCANEDCELQGVPRGPRRGEFERSTNMRIRCTPSALGFVLVMTAGAIGVYAQGYGSATGEKKQKTPPAHLDARLFIKDMTLAGLAEIELGKVAAQKAADPEVRAFGEAMVKDHTEANEKLAKIASQLNVQPPTQLDKKHQELVAKLSALEGSTFDREYMTAMAHRHEEDLFNLKARTGPTRPSSDPA